MMSFKKGARNPSFDKQSLWQRLAVQDIIMQNDIAHKLSPSEASLRVKVQDVTV